MEPEHEQEEHREHLDAGQEQDQEDEFFVGQEDEIVEDMEGPEGEDGDEEEDDEDEEDDSIGVSASHTEAVYSVAWNPVQHEQLASGSGDDTATLWNTQSGAKLKLEDHTDTVGVVAFSRDGTLLATGGLDGKVVVWQAQTGQLLHVLEGSGEGIEWLTWHSRGNVLAAGGEGSTVWMWNAQTAACLQVFTGHEGSVRCGVFNPDGKSLVTAGGEGDASLRVWDPKSGTAAVKVHGALFHGAGLTALAVDPTGALAVSGDEEGSVYVTTLASGKVVGSLTGATDSVEHVAFSPSQSLIAVASLDGNVRLYDVATRTLRISCKHDVGVPRFVFHPTLPMLFTACLDGVARTWDQRSGVCSRSWRGHQAPIQDISVSADGKMLATGADDHTTRLFRLEE